MTSAAHEPPRAGRFATSRRLARDLFPGRVTPFTWSVLRGPVDRGLRWACHQLGAPLPAGGLWRRGDDGIVYLDEPALLEADAALQGAAWWVAPIGVRGGLRARLQAAGANRKLQGRMAAVPAEAASLVAQNAAWLGRVRRLHWSQADLLQVMEELEPRATAALGIYFLTRAGLNAAATHVLERTASAGTALEATAGALYAGLDGLPTIEAAHALRALANLPPEKAAEALAQYGHRGPGEAGADAVRWSENPAVLTRLRVEQRAPTAATARALRESAEADMRSTRSSQWSQAAESLALARLLARAADQAWDGLVAVVATAQLWLAAVAREAVATRVAERTDDAGYLELEELKQVATGEWHEGRSREAQEEVSRRRTALAAAPSLPAGASSIVPVSPGAVRGPAHCGWPATPPAPSSIWLADTLDPGAAPFWLVAGAVVAGSPDPWSPGMIAAKVLGIPAVAGAEEAVAHCTAGESMLVDVGRGVVRADTVV